MIDQNIRKNLINKTTCHQIPRLTTLSHLFYEFYEELYIGQDTETRAT